MFLKIAICEDVVIHRLLLRDHLERFTTIHDIAYELDELCTSKELLAIPNIYDILFLDVQLEDGVNSLEIAQQVVDNGFDAEIVLVTSYERYAAQGYRLNARRYLVKPVSQERFDEAMCCCMRRIVRQNRKIEVRCAYGNCYVSTDKIFYIESYERKRTIYTAEHVYETGMTLAELLALLPTEQFGVPQKSYIVNFEYIAGMTKSKVLLEDGTEINLSRRRAEEFHTQFQKYIRR